MELSEKRSKQSYTTLFLGTGRSLKVPLSEILRNK
jgi:hypothetical protein